MELKYETVELCHLPQGQNIGRIPDHHELDVSSLLPQLSSSSCYSKETIIMHIQCQSNLGGIGKWFQVVGRVCIDIWTGVSFQ